MPEKEFIFSKFYTRNLQVNSKRSPPKVFFQGFFLNFKQFPINLYFFKGAYLSELILMAASDFSVVNSKNFSSP